MTDDALMAEALALAARGRLRVEPNPPVGAIVLDAGGRVVGRGFHAAYGGPHAEPVALADAGDAARGGTLVTTLEPCAHTAKKTPPCADAIIAAGVTRVVAGAPDPNPATSGLAGTRFREAGIAYEPGVGREECELLLERYARHLARDVPWTIGKWAMSADGRLADDDRSARWITGEASRELVHGIRARVEAIVVGRGTVDADDPHLTCRVPGAASPLRVVLDSGLSISTAARVVAGAGEVPTLLVCGPSAPAERRSALRAAGAEVVEVAADGRGRVLAEAAWTMLHARGVRRVLLEGGGRLLGSCLRAGLVHQVMAFTAPVLLGGSAAPRPLEGSGWPIDRAPRLEEPRVTAIGSDSLLEGYWPAAVTP